MTMLASTPHKYRRDEVRCACGKLLGEWSDRSVIMRRAGLILRGGYHTIICIACGVSQELDLRTKRVT